MSERKRKVTTEHATIEQRQHLNLPWRRDGAVIAEASESATELAYRARLDYSVEKVELSGVIPGTDIKITSTSADLYSNFNNGQWERINSIPNAQRYEIVNNMQIAELLDRPASDGYSLVDLFPCDAAGAFGKGMQSFFCLQMGSDSVKIGKDGSDDYVSHLFIQQDHLAGFLRVGLASSRIACLNTLNRALGESARDKTLWSFSNRDNPMEWLNFRLSLESKAQESRRIFYNELQTMVDTNWGITGRELFIQEVFPMPSILPKSVRRLGFAIDGMDQAVLEPVEAIASADQSQFDRNVERAERNQALLRSRIEDYENQFNGYSVYAALNGATDMIGWTKERNDWASVGQSVLFGARNNDLNRAYEYTRKWISEN